MRFEVQPQALHEQAPAIGRHSGQLAELAGKVRGLAGNAGALERFAQVWSESVRLLADSIAALGAATGSAATTYTATDAGDHAGRQVTAMPVAAPEPWAAIPTGDPKALRAAAGRLSAAATALDGIAASFAAAAEAAAGGRRWVGPASLSFRRHDQETRQALGSGSRPCTTPPQC
jgi:hypothetical protein